MRSSRYLFPLLALIAAISVSRAGGPVHATGLDSQPPPPVPVAGGWVPAEVVREIDYVDDGGANFQENLADDGGQSASASTAASASGTSGNVLASDNFSNSSSGLLPTASTRPTQWKVGYVNGEYQIASVGSGANLDDTALVKGTYGDVTISVDARVIQGTAVAPDQTVRLYCRRQVSGSGFTGYRFQYSPVTNKWGLYRGDGSTGYTLTNVQDSAGIASPGGTHHLSMTCAGSTISVSIDGTKVGTFQDRSYASGVAALGVGNFTLNDTWGIYPPHSAYPGTYDVRFSKLVLTQP